MKALALFSLIVVPLISHAQNGGNMPGKSFSLAQKAWHSSADIQFLNTKQLHFLKLKNASGSNSFCPYDPAKEWKESSFIQDVNKARPRVIIYEVTPDYTMQYQKWWGNQYNNLNPGYNYSDSYLIQGAWNLGLYLLDPAHNR